MHRPDAHTVSFSWITVATERVSFRYTPRSPCRGLILDEPVELPRIAAPD